MEDKNKNNLKSALDKLPSYAPKSSLWDNIESDMQALSTTYILTDAIGNLPIHSPSDKVWNAIESGLDTDKRLKSNTLRVKRYRQWSAAAAILLLVGAFYFITNNSLNTGETIEYAEEIVDDQLLERNWDVEEEDAYQKILAFCEMQTFSCTQPVFQSLKSELEELNSARDMLKTAIGEYGTDIELIKELNEIEMLRTSLLKELAAQIV